MKLTTFKLVFFVLITISSNHLRRSSKYSKYLIIKERIGKGAQGTVYGAVQNFGNSEKLAVKVVNFNENSGCDDVQDSKLLEVCIQNHRRNTTQAFNQEVEIMQRLSNRSNGKIGNLCAQSIEIGSEIKLEAPFSDSMSVTEDLPVTELIFASSNEDIGVIVMRRYYSFMEEFSLVYDDLHKLEPYY